MNGKLLFCVIFTVHIYVTNAVPFITKCRAEDSECLRQTAQTAVPVFAAGIPEYNMPPLDPLHIDRVDGISRNLNFTNTNIIVTGMKDCIVEKVVRNAAKLKIDVTTMCEKLTYTSQYEVHGSILIVPFEGQGDLRVVLKKIRMRVFSDLVETMDKQGRKHWNIKKFKYDYELNGKSEIEMSNLFEGNDILGRAARHLISTSSNEAVLEVSPPVNKAIIERIVKSINQFYHSVPVDDLVLD